MENKKKIIYLLSFMFFIMSCNKHNVIKYAKEKNEYYNVKDILYKDNQDNYYLRYPYASREEDKIKTSYGYENKGLNINDNSVHELKEIINIKTFKLIKYPYYTDNKFVYVINNYAGSPNCSFYPIDINTLRMAGNYIHDNKNVFYFSKKIKNVDVKNFNSKIFNKTELPIELGFDNFSLYFQEKKMLYSDFQKLEINKKTKDSLSKKYFPDHKLLIGTEGN